MVSLRAPLRARSTRHAGFSYIELMVIMGIVAMLMGLTVGWLQGAGRVGSLAVARTQLLDAVNRGKAQSRGGRLSTLTFRRSLDLNDRPVDQIVTHVAENVLSHAFERLDGPSRLLPMEVVGDVRIDPLGGHTGGCALFGRGGSLAFAPQASFAVTEGLEFEAWIQPTGNAAFMTLIDGEGSYEISLFRALSGSDYDLRLRVNLRPAEEQGEPSWTSFETDSAPVKATGRWVHVRVAYDGLAPLFEVDTLERAVRVPTGARAPVTSAAGAAAPVRARRIAVPALGAVALRVGSQNQPYQGRMDGLVFRGVFRLADDIVELPSGLTFEVRQPARTALPFRVRYANGRLDEVKHPEDVVLVVRDTGRPDDPPLEIELGRGGLVRADMGQVPGGAQGAPPPTPATPPASPPATPPATPRGGG